LHRSARPQRLRAGDIAESITYIVTSPSAQLMVVLDATVVNIALPSA
jgi:hypothetical protein